MWERVETAQTMLPLLETIFKKGNPDFVGTLDPDFTYVIFVLFQNIITQNNRGVLCNIFEQTNSFTIQP